MTCMLFIFSPLIPFLTFVFASVRGLYISAFRGLILKYSYVGRTLISRFSFANSCNHHVAAAQCLPEGLGAGAQIKVLLDK